MINRNYTVIVSLAVMLASAPIAADSCVQDFDYVSPIGHGKAASSLKTLKQAFGAAAKGDFEGFMAAAADPYIQHSPDLPDGWKPVWDLLQNREEGFSSKQLNWLGENGFLDNGQYLVMLREVDHGEGPSKKFDLLYFDDDGLYAEHWDMAEKMADKTASGRSETGAAAKFTDNPVEYDQATEEANRRMIASMINLGWNSGQLALALSTFADRNYVQHNPYIGDGIKPLTDRANAGKLPQRCYDLKFVLAQNDLVWVYSKVTEADAVNAVVDLFRVRNGKMVEHWDVSQAVPDEMPHDNGMF